MFKNHPKGLIVLFFANMGERFGYYTMIPIFALFFQAKFGMSPESVGNLWSAFLFAIYFLPLFGGILADKIGYGRTITVGIVFMIIGYALMGIPTNSMLFIYFALFVIALGTGFFKGNLAVILGNLYEEQGYKKLHDAAFNIFYMGINIGAFLCNFVAAYLRLEYGWGWAFAAAGVGMLIGVIWLFVGQGVAQRIKDVDTITPMEEGDMSLKQIFLKMFVPALVAGLLGWLIPGSIFGADSTDAFLFFSIPIVLFYINLVRNAKKEEKEPIKALLAIMGVVVIFWAIFHQNGSALTFWTQNNTDREVSETTASILSVMKLSEEVSTVPRISEKQGLHGEFKGYELGESYYFANYDKSKLPKGNLSKSYPSDMKQYFDTVDYVKKTSEHFAKMLAEANDPTEKKALDEKYSKWKSEKDVLLNELTIAYEDKPFDWEKIRDEQKLEWGSLNIWPTELQASINPFFIIILTPLVVGFLGFLGKRKRAPSTPAKIGIGLLITALSMFVMVGAAIVSDSGAVKTSTAWLFGLYGVITVGELFLSPMGLSLVSKLSPKRIGAVMMGGWFLSTAIGNKLSGVLSGTWDFFEKKEYFFLTNMGLVMIAVVGIFIMLPWLRRVVKEHTGE